ncbi:MAG: AsmA-like C-terminal region-containing protein [Bacteroidota bacterium]
MKKKLLRVLVLAFVLIMALLVAVPFFLEAKIGELIRNNVNNNVNATLDFSEARLSLIRSFPNAQLRMEEVTLTTKAPFEGDTLFATKTLDLTLGLGELFKGPGEAIGLKNLAVDGAYVYVQVNEDEVASYEIGKESGGEVVEEESAESGFTLDLQSYAITNSQVVYDDRAAKVYMSVSDIQHSGRGDLSATTSELETRTNALVSFALDSTYYLHETRIGLDALIGIDLKEDTYTFLKNEALINQLPLVFNGFVKVNEDNQEVDISFKTPSSDFKNFLAVLPEQYSGNIQNVSTTGDFKVEGAFTGMVDEMHIPKFSIGLYSDNASFKYPDLPKSVSQVYIDTKINNSTGRAEDTFVNIDKLSFTIDKDVFNMVAKITDLMGNTKVNAHVDGNMDLANLSQAYPMPQDLDVSGILKADITTAFDMASVENGQYENTTTSGNLALNNFEYRSEEIAHPVQLQRVDMAFNPTTVKVKRLQGSTGQTDFAINGTLDNLLGFLFNDEEVKGGFTMTSNTFALDDFMVEETDTAEGEMQDLEIRPASEEAIRIPSFLDVGIKAIANTVLYDNIKLTDVRGDLRIKDQRAILSNMSSSLFNGKVVFNGVVSTQGETPDFAMKLDMSQLGIGETFKSLEMFQALVPIAQVFQGTMDTELELSGNLTNDFTPELTTLAGKALALVQTEKLDSDNAPLLSAFNGKLDFVDLEKLNIKDLKTALSFENGLVKVKPFSLQYEDIGITVDGGHSFDRQMNYNVVMRVPTKYLGKEVNNLIAQIDDKELDGLTVPVTAQIGGTYSSPDISTDLTSGVKNLTAQLVEVQKEKLINQGTDRAKDFLGNILDTNTSEKDSLKAESDGDGIKEVLGGILGNGTTATADSTATDSSANDTKDPIKETARGILGGLLGKKKDTVN